MMPVYVLGGSQSDFAVHLARSGNDLGSLVGYCVDATLADAAIEATDVDTIHVGNAFGELFTGQAQLGAMPATMRPALAGVPASRHEAACASGSIAILAAMAELEAGRYDCALVLGVEQERNVAGELAAQYLGAAAWVGHEGQDARYLWPSMFSQLGDAYAERWGLSREHLVAIAKKNLANARANPFAQTRAWTVTDESFGEHDGNPVVEGRLRRHDCAQITDGAAGLVLASARFATAYAHRRKLALERLPRITGWGHRTAGLGLAAKLAAHTDHATHLFPHVRRAIVDAYGRAAISGPPELDGIETHDCFTTTEYMAIDHFGITPPGEGWRAIEDGLLERTGNLPMNPSGGLMGVGHPVGATGVRMLHDATRQVAGRAADLQVAGARRFATLNLGGSATTAVCFVVEA